MGKTNKLTKNLWQKIKEKYKEGTLMKNAKEYLLGNYRYMIYYSILSMILLRKHIREQIDDRLRWMERECYNTGSCIICGCQTVQLQMANKSCDKPCYPEMMSRKEWKKYNSYYIIVQGNRYWKKDYKTGKPVCVININPHS